MVSIVILKQKRRHLAVEFDENVYAVAVYNHGLLVAVLPEQVNIPLHSMHQAM